MKRLILVCAVLLLAPSLFAQQDDWYDARQEARDARQEAREAAREARREAREAMREARQARREAMRDFGRGRDGVHLRILKSYTLRAGEVADVPVVVIGGSAQIDGRAEHDVTVIGGTLRVGPTGVIAGDAAAVGGEIVVAPDGRIVGQVDETVVVWPNVDFGWGGISGGFWEAAAFGATILRLGVIFILSLLITWFAPGWTDRVGARAADAAGSSLLLGFFGQMLMVPLLVIVSIILVVTIIGIPVALVLPIIIGLLWVGGFAGVVVRLGARLRGQGAGQSSSPTLDLLAGFVAVTTFTLLARLLALGPDWMGPMAFVTAGLGLFTEWIVWTLGLGAALTAFGQRPMAPPVVPVIPVPAPPTMSM